MPVDGGRGENSTRAPCDARAEFNYPHGGRTRLYQIEVYTQPPGHGSFTLRTTVRLCDHHRKWFDGENSHYVHMELERV